VCHAFSKLFDDNNAIFSDNVRVASLSLILELLRREPGSIGIQMYGSLALANLCGRHSGSAQEAAMAGAYELLLAAHRMHLHDATIQGNALLAIARIAGSYPPSAPRAAAAGAVPRFVDALKQVLLDDSATAHVAAALAQLYTLSIRDEPRSLPALEALAQLLHRHPASGAGAVRAGAAEALPSVLQACPEEAVLQAVGSCALGRFILAQPGYATVCVSSGAVELLLLALRMHGGDRRVVVEVSQNIVVLMKALPSTSMSIYAAGGDTLLEEAARRHPEAVDVRQNVTVAFRIFGKRVPDLTPFPFVPAPPPE